MHLTQILSVGTVQYMYMGIIELYIVYYHLISPSLITITNIISLLA